jgi:hypothetical protein
VLLLSFRKFTSHVVDAAWTNHNRIQIHRFPLVPDHGVLERTLRTPLVYDFGLIINPNFHEFSHLENWTVQ